jgi:membrane peptidoglycan carboxypeptidase
LGFTEREIEAGGLRVHTTFDPKAQSAMVAAFTKGFPPDSARVHAGGASVRPGTGEVVAMYGGTNYLRRQFNDATQAKIPPGSSFKPFALAAALEKGISLKSRFWGNSPFKDEGVKVNNEGDRDYGRSVDLLKATEDSINTAYVDMTINELGPDKVVDAAVRAGVPKDSPGLEDNPQVALGSASVPAIDMANAYATFAAGGREVRWHLIDEVTTRTGEVKYAWDKDPKAKPKQVFPEDVVRDVTYALTQVVEKGSGRRAQDLDRPSAGKTGTHEGLTAWYAGYTPQLATAISFYREGNGGLESLDGVGGLEDFTGGRYPAQIWTAYMKAVLEGQPVEEFEKPAWIGKSVNPKPKPSRTSRPDPDPEPSKEPSKEPDPEPSKEPTKEPSPDPQPEPSDPPPTQEPEPEPEPSDPPPSEEPEPRPSKEPTKAPSPKPADDGNPSLSGGAP